MLGRGAIAVSAALPALALLGYGIAKTRSDWRNEALWTAFLVGGAGVIAVFAIEIPLESLVRASRIGPAASALVSALLVAAIPEEGIKFVVVVFIALRHVDARRQQDTVALALAASLGFAAMENLFYLFVPGDWVARALARATTTIPGHGLDGIVMGALLTKARLAGNPKFGRFALALAVPIVLHACYDFPVMLLERDNTALWAEPTWAAVLVLEAFLAIILCNRLLPLAEAADRSAGDHRAPMSNRSLTLGGIGLAVTGPAAALGVLLVNSHNANWIAAALMVLPAAFGIDLVRTGRRRASAGR